MKIKKGLQILNELYISSKRPTKSYTKEELLKAYEKLCVENNTIIESYKSFFEEDSKVPCSFVVQDCNSHPIIAEVKIFPLNIDKRFLDFKRFYTNDNGKLNISLPTDKFKVVISKGVQYENLTFEIDLCNKEELTKSVKLKTILNLNELHWYGGDLHHHSVFSSPKHGGTDNVVETPKEVRMSMESVGLSFGALSDHHNIFNHEIWKSEEDERFTPIISKEISTSNGHVLSLNVPVDVIYKIPKEEERTKDYLKKEFLRVTDEIKQYGIAQLNHPKDRQQAISLNMDFYDMLEIYDTIEVWNGSNPLEKGSSNYDAFEMWIDLLKEGRRFSATTGSDTHNIRVDDYNDDFTKLILMLDKYNGDEEIVLYLKDVINTVYNDVKLWIEETLGSGCVSTYIYQDDKLNPKNILESLKNGYSFLTNGPIFIPTFDNKNIWESINDKSNININFKIVSKKPLKELIMYTDKGEIVLSEDLKNISMENYFYDYSFSLNNYDLSQYKFVLFKVKGHFTNQAFTNPIML